MDFIIETTTSDLCMYVCMYVCAAPECRENNLRVNGDIVQVCREKEGENNRWVSLSCEENSNFNIMTLETCLNNSKYTHTHTHTH